MADSLASRANADVASLAVKVGIRPKQAEATIAALANARGAPIGTVTTATAHTGALVHNLQQILGHIGGKGPVGAFASLIQNGAGRHVLGQLGGITGGLFGKK